MQNVSTITVQILTNKFKKTFLIAAISAVCENEFTVK